MWLFSKFVTSKTKFKHHWWQPFGKSPKVYWNSNGHLSVYPHMAVALHILYPIALGISSYAKATSSFTAQFHCSLLIDSQNECMQHNLVRKWKADDEMHIIRVFCIRSHALHMHKDTQLTNLLYVQNSSFGTLDMAIKVCIYILVHTDRSLHGVHACDLTSSVER